MSKIGKINIAIPEKVKVSIDGSQLKMEGPLGKNNLALDVNMFDLNIKDGKEVSIKPKSINQEKNKVNVYSKATLSLNENNYRIKLRLKGDRAIHWHDKESSSYKIDVRGGDTIWGMEEFSVQKPIARNYIYEFTH